LIDSDCQGQFAASQQELAACQGQLAASQDELAALEGQLAASQKELAACLEEPGGPPDIPGFTFSEMNAQGFSEYTHAETGIVFVRLPGNEELKPFLIAKHEVTQGQYEAVMGMNPSRFTGDDNRPVEKVSWNDLKADDGFLERTGLSLPSDAQWEYAARGGTTTEFSWGDECNVGGCDPCTPAVNHMWYCANAGETSHPVGRKLPNPFGLHDVHGNVWEWCEDEFSPGSVLRVFRGGGFDGLARLCRSAYRYGGSPANRGFFLGFRPAAPSP